MADATRRALLRPLLVGAALLVAVFAALLAAERVMGAPPGDVQQLALFLSVSGGGSLAVGALLVWWAGGGLGSLRLRLAFVCAIGVLIALANVLATSALMFLNSHDLALVLLLLAFSAFISLAFAFAAAGGLARDLENVARAAGRLAEGDLSVRIHARGSDEVAQVARSFDRMADELQRAFERERALDATRRELVAAVSHDLRTPVATTRAMVEAIADGVVADEHEVRRYVSLIHREIQHLGHLIDDLFELSQIESGELRLSLAPTRLDDLLSDTAAAYEARAQERGVALDVRAAPLLVRVDAARVLRVLRNLADNALRHTPAGGRVTLEGERRDGLALVRVRDTGPGVPAGERERVFERFYRGDRARGREDGAAERTTNAGLGLAIARGLVEAHGGSIRVEDTEPGAAFVFTLPLAADPPR